MSAGVASLPTKALTVGRDSITAIYLGDPTYATSTSSALSESIKSAATTTTLSSSLNPSAFRQSVTFTAAVTSAGGTPTGSVTLKSGSTTLGTGALNSSGVATLTTAALQKGTDSITASYGRAADFSVSNSSALSQAVN